MTENQDKQQATSETPHEQSYDPGADPELRRQIEEGLDMIRPYLMADGGSVRSSLPSCSSRSP